MTTLKQLRRMANSPDCEGVFFYDGPRKIFIPDMSDADRYTARVNGEIQRIVGTMRHPEMLRMALDLTVQEDGSILLTPKDDGFEYVQARIKHHDTTEAERSDLRKVVSAYKLADDHRQLMTALDKRDYRRINRILNGKGVRA